MHTSAIKAVIFLDHPSTWVARIFYLVCFVYLVCFCEENFNKHIKKKHDPAHTAVVSIALTSAADRKGSVGITHRTRVSCTVFLCEWAIISMLCYLNHNTFFVQSQRKRVTGGSREPQTSCTKSRIGS